jgi:hypothetical protein
MVATKDTGACDTQCAITTRPLVLQHGEIRVRRGFDVDWGC